MKRIWVERGGALVLAVWAFYLWLAPSFPVDGESAEFSTLAVTGGAAHPPGYPLYVLWLRATSWLPGASAAHAAAIATAVLGAAAIAILHAACRAWGARPLAASVTVAIVAVSPIVLRVHTEAEVFALNNLVAALVLWLAAEHGPLRGVRRAFALGLVAGLGLANHTTCVLLAPIGILGVVRGVRETDRRALAIALAVSGLVIGLLPYTYLLVAPDSRMAWSKASSVGDLLAYFTRADYGGAGRFAPIGGERDVVAQVAAFAITLGRSWLWLPAGLGVGILAYRCARVGGREPRLGWIALAAAWLLAGVVLATRFDIAPEGVGLLVVQRFHVLPVLLLAPAVAVGLDRVGELLEPRIARVPLAPAIPVLLAIALAATALGPHRRIASPAVEKSAENTLKMLPPNAVVLAQTDDLHAGAAYAQEVLGIRRDVTVVTFGMLTLPWYRARIARGGLSLEPSLRAAEQVLESGRPLFVDRSQPGIIATYPVYPHGWLFRVLPRGERPPTLDEIVALNKDITAHLDLDYPRPGPDDGYPTGIHKRYAQPWKILGRALAEAGRTEDARDALAIANQLAPERP